MPKEITHWAIARKAASRCDARLRGMIEKNISLYLAGAVAVDSPYYAVFGGGPIKQAGARLHGMGGATASEVVSQVIDVAKVGDDDEALTFTLGALTHLIADAVFHPMIYYLTGDYHDPDDKRREKAVTRHRTLETWIDVWFAGELDSKTNRTFFRHAVAAVMKTRGFGRLESALFFGRDDMPATALKTVASHAIIQSLFYSRVAEKMIALYGRLAQRDMGEFTALFYPPPGTVMPSFLSGSIRYKNPLTGEAFEKTLEELEQETLDACLRLFEVAACNPTSTALAGECSRLIPSVTLKDRKFFHFAPDQEMDELWQALSCFRTRG